MFLSRNLLRPPLDPLQPQRFGRRAPNRKPLTEAELRSNMRPRSRRFWVGGTLFLVALGYFSQSPLLLLAAVLIFSMGIVPEVWFWVVLRGVRFQRTFTDKRVHVGQATQISFEIENHKWLPVPWLEVEDELAYELAMPTAPLYPSYKPDRQLFISSFSLWGRQRVTRRYQIVAGARGVWRFGPAYLRAGDPFGFLERERQVHGGQATLTVLPIVAPLTQFKLPMRNPFGDFEAQRRLIEDPNEIIGARDYLPGDPIRRVHWKATARNTTLQSKVYPFTTTHTLAIFFDIYTSESPVGGFNTALFELGIAAAASIANWAMQARFAVGLFSNGIPLSTDDEAMTSLEQMHAFMRLPPSAHPSQLMRIWEALARLQPLFGMPMERLIAHEQHHLPMGATIVVISAAPALRPNTVALLEKLRRRGYIVAVLLTGDLPVDTGTLVTYRLGGEEAWHALTEFANRKGTHDANGAEDGDMGRIPDDGERPTADTGAPLADHHEPAFRVG